MAPGALQARIQRAFNTSKIFEIDLQILTGDGFENMFCGVLTKFY